MRILTLGGGGNIGFWVEKLFLEDNHLVFSIQRGKTLHKRKISSSFENFTLLSEDLIQPSKTLIKNINEFDVVIDFLCFDSFSAHSRIELLSGFEGVFLMISSVAVYDRIEGLNELSSSSSCEHLGWSYARKKREAELLLLANLNSKQKKICRLGHTFDTSLPVPFGPVDWTIAQWLIDGNPLMIHQKSQVPWPILHSADAAKRIIKVATEPENFPEILNIVSSAGSTWTEIGSGLFASLGIYESFRYLSVEDLVEINPYWSESVLYHKRFEERYLGEDISQFNDLEVGDLGLFTGISLSLDWYLSNRSYQTVNQSHYAQLELLLEHSTDF